MQRLLTAAVLVPLLYGAIKWASAPVFYGVAVLVIVGACWECYPMMRHCAASPLVLPGLAATAATVWAHSGLDPGLGGPAVPPMALMLVAVPAAMALRPSLERIGGPSFFPRSTFRLPGFLRGNQQAGVPCGLKQIADIPGGHPQSGLFLLVSVAVGFFKTETKAERTGRRGGQRTLPIVYLPGQRSQFRRIAGHGSIARSQRVQPPVVGAFKVLRSPPEPARVRQPIRGPDQVIDNFLDKRGEHGSGRWSARLIRNRFQ